MFKQCSRSLFAFIIALLVRNVLTQIKTDNNTATTPETILADTINVATDATNDHTDLITNLRKITEAFLLSQLNETSTEEIKTSTVMANTNSDVQVSSSNILQTNNEHQGQTLKGLGIEKQLKYGAILRENVVSALGYLLYFQNETLSINHNTALSTLYTDTRNRRYISVNLLPILSKIKKGQYKEQLIALLDQLSNVASESAKQSAIILKNAITNNEFDTIFKNNNNNFIDLTKNLPEEANRFTDTISGSTDAAYRTFFDDVIKSLKDKSMLDTSCLIAGLLINLPRDLYIPEINDAERTVYEFMNSLNEAAVPDGKAVTVYDYVLHILKSLAQFSEIDPKLREALMILIPFIGEPTNVVVSPYINKLASITDKDNIDYSALFSTIDYSQFPGDVVFAANQISKLIQTGALNIKDVLKDFNPYEYFIPCDLLVAVLAYLRKNDSVQSDLKNLIKSLYSHTRLRFTPPYAKSRSIRGDADLLLLLEAYDNLNDPIYNELTNAKVALKRQLKTSNINWNAFNKFNFDKCEEPRKCLVQLFFELLSSQNNNLNLDYINNIRRFLSLVNILGQPIASDFRPIDVISSLDGNSQYGPPPPQEVIDIGKQPISYKTYGNVYKLDNPVQNIPYPNAIYNSNIELQNQMKPIVAHNNIPALPANNINNNKIKLTTNYLHGAPEISNGYSQRRFNLVGTNNPNNMEGSAVLANERDESKLNILSLPDAPIVETNLDNARLQSQQTELSPVLYNNFIPNQFIDFGFHSQNRLKKSSQLNSVPPKETLIFRVPRGSNALDNRILKVSGSPPVFHRRWAIWK